MSGPYRKDSDFNSFKLGRLKSQEDIIKSLEAMARHISDISYKANKEFARVESAKTGAGSTVIVTGGSSGSGSGSSGQSSLLDLGIRAGKETVVASGTDIFFTLPMPTGDFTLFISCYKTTNPKEAIDFNYSNVSVTGFRITPLDDCTCEYFVVPKT
jgi:hypothetical protein